jgi:hexulose-6-phosphate isomerase
MNPSTVRRILMDCGIKKGINMWSFPNGMSIIDCMKLAKKAGFEGIELTLSKNGELNMDSSDDEIKRFKSAAEEIGIIINSIASGLYWEYSLTSDREDIREKAKKLVMKQLDVANLLGADTVLVFPGIVGVDFKPIEVVPDAENIDFFVGMEIIDYDIAYERSLKAIKELAHYAESKKVYIGIENIWNKFLLSPLEMRNFIDETGSSWVGAFLDVANMMLYGYPEHWIKILGSRIKKVHFKDFRRATPTINGFVDLLAGDVDYIKVIDAFIKTGYKGWANAEMCPVYKQYSDQIVFNASATMDRILRRS